MIILLILAGFTIGMISGFIGIGGGTMLVPLFMYVFKMSIYRAVGTSLAVIAPVSLVGAISHHLKGNVDLVPVLAVGIAASGGIFLSGQLIQYIPPPFLKKAFALFLIVVAVDLLRR